MRTIVGWYRRLVGVCDRGRRDRELHEELEAHLQLHADDNRRAGMSPETARRHAVVALGGVEQVAEQYRDQGGIPLLEDIVKDVRFALRMMRRNPGFSAVVLLTLTVGIGANTVMFSVVNTVLLRPLPYRDPQQLMLPRAGGYCASF